MISYLNNLSRKKKIIAQYLFICSQKKIIFIVKTDIFFSVERKREKLNKNKNEYQFNLNVDQNQQFSIDDKNIEYSFIHCFGVADEKYNKSDKVKISFKPEFLLFHILYENFVDFSKNLNRNHIILKDNFIETNIVIIQNILIQNTFET